MNANLEPFLALGAGAVRDRFAPPKLPWYASASAQTGITIAAIVALGMLLAVGIAQ